MASGLTTVARSLLSVVLIPHILKVVLANCNCLEAKYQEPWWKYYQPSFRNFNAMSEPQNLQTPFQNRKEEIPSPEKWFPPQSLGINDFNPKNTHIQQWNPPQCPAYIQVSPNSWIPNTVCPLNRVQGIKNDIQEHCRCARTPIKEIYIPLFQQSFENLHHLPKVLKQFYEIPDDPRKPPKIWVYISGTESTMRDIQMQIRNQPTTTGNIYVYYYLDPYCIYLGCTTAQGLNEALNGACYHIHLTPRWFFKLFYPNRRPLLQSNLSHLEQFLQTKGFQPSDERSVLETELNPLLRNGYSRNIFPLEPQFDQDIASHNNPILPDIAEFSPTSNSQIAPTQPNLTEFPLQITQLTDLGPQMGPTLTNIAEITHENIPQSVPSILNVAGFAPQIMPTLSDLPENVSQIPTIPALADIDLQIGSTQPDQAEISQESIPMIPTLRQVTPQVTPTLPNIAESAPQINPTVRDIIEFALNNAHTLPDIAEYTSAMVAPLPVMRSRVGLLDNLFNSEEMFPQELYTLPYRGIPAHFLPQPETTKSQQIFPSECEPLVTPQFSNTVDSSRHPSIFHYEQRVPQTIDISHYGEISEPLIPQLDAMPEITQLQSMVSSEHEQVIRPQNPVFSSRPKLLDFEEFVPQTIDALHYEDTQAPFITQLDAMPESTKLQTTFSTEYKPVISREHLVDSSRPTLLDFKEIAPQMIDTLPHEEIPATLIPQLDTMPEFTLLQPMLSSEYEPENPVDDSIQTLFESKEIVPQTIEDTPTPFIPQLDELREFIQYQPTFSTEYEPVISPQHLVDSSRPTLLDFKDMAPQTIDTLPKEEIPGTLIPQLDTMPEFTQLLPMLSSEYEAEIPIDHSISPILDSKRIVPQTTDALHYEDTSAPFIPQLGELPEFIQYQPTFSTEYEPVIRPQNLVAASRPTSLGSEEIVPRTIDTLPYEEIPAPLIPQLDVNQEFTQYQPTFSTEYQPVISPQNLVDSSKPTLLDFKEIAPETIDTLPYEEIPATLIPQLDTMQEFTQLLPMLSSEYERENPVDNSISTLLDSTEIVPQTTDALHYEDTPAPFIPQLGELPEFMQYQPTFFTKYGPVIRPENLVAPARPTSLGSEKIVPRTIDTLPYEEIPAPLIPQLGNLPEFIQYQPTFSTEYEPVIRPQNLVASSRPTSLGSEEIVPRTIDTLPYEEIPAPLIPQLGELPEFIQYQPTSSTEYEPVIRPQNLVAASRPISLGSEEIVPRTIDTLPYEEIPAPLIPQLDVNQEFTQYQPTFSTEYQTVINPQNLADSSKPTLLDFKEIAPETIDTLPYEEIPATLIPQLDTMQEFTQLLPMLSSEYERENPVDNSISTLLDSTEMVPQTTDALHYEDTPAPFIPQLGELPEFMQYQPTFFTKYEPVIRPENLVAPARPTSLGSEEIVPRTIDTLPYEEIPATLIPQLDTMPEFTQLLPMLSSEYERENPVVNSISTLLDSTEIVPQTTDELHYEDTPASFIPQLGKLPKCMRYQPTFFTKYEPVIRPENLVAPATPTSLGSEEIVPRTIDTLPYEEIPAPIVPQLGNLPEFIQYQPTFSTEYEPVIRPQNLVASSRPTSLGSEEIVARTIDILPYEEIPAPLIPQLDVNQEFTQYQPTFSTEYQPVISPQNLVGSSKPTLLDFKEIAPETIDTLPYEEIPATLIPQLDTMQEFTQLLPMLSSEYERENPVDNSISTLLHSTGIVPQTTDELHYEDTPASFIPQLGKLPEFMRYQPTFFTKYEPVIRPENLVAPATPTSLGSEEIVPRTIDTLPYEEIPAPLIPQLGNLTEFIQYQPTFSTEYEPVIRPLNLVASSRPTSLGSEEIVPQTIYTPYGEILAPLTPQLDVNPEFAQYQPKFSSDYEPIMSSYSNPADSSRLQTIYDSEQIVPHTIPYGEISEHLIPQLDAMPVFTQLQPMLSTECEPENLVDNSIATLLNTKELLPPIIDALQYRVSPAPCIPQYRVSPAPCIPQLNAMPESSQFQSMFSSDREPEITPNINPEDYSRRLTLFNPNQMLPHIIDTLRYGETPAPRTPQFDRNPEFPQFQPTFSSDYEPVMTPYINSAVSSRLPTLYGFEQILPQTINTPLYGNISEPLISHVDTMPEFSQLQPMFSSEYKPVNHVDSRPTLLHSEEVEPQMIDALNYRDIQASTYHTIPQQDAMPVQSMFTSEYEPVMTSQILPEDHSILPMKRPGMVPITKESDSFQPFETTSFQSSLFPKSYKNTFIDAGNVTTSSVNMPSLYTISQHNPADSPTRHTIKSILSLLTPEQLAQLHNTNEDVTIPITSEAVTKLMSEPSQVFKIPTRCPCVYLKAWYAPVEVFTVSIKALPTHDKILHVMPQSSKCMACRKYASNPELVENICKDNLESKGKIPIYADKLFTESPYATVNLPDDWENGNYVVVWPTL